MYFYHAFGIISVGTIFWGAILDFLPIRTSTIRGNQKLLFNLYLKIRDREVLYIKKNQPIEDKILHRLKAKKIKRVFIEVSAENDYLQYLEANLKKVNDTSVPIEERSSILEGQAIGSVEDIYADPQNQAAFTHNKKVVNQYVKFLNHNEKAASYLMKLQNQHFDCYQHALNVTSLSVSLALEESQDKEAIEKLGMASLLHDIGKSNLSIDPSRPIETFTDKELQIYKTHPELGANLLKKGNYVSDEIVEIVRQHEELPDGSGYPNKLTATELQPLTKYLTIANFYDRYITFYHLAPIEAIERLKEDTNHIFGAQHIDKLQTLLEKQKVIIYE